jgi:hypothetical protein
MRADLANKSPSEFEKQYLSFYADLYPGVRTAAPLEAVDDRDADTITVREAYELPAQAVAKIAGRFQLRASALDDYKEPAADERHTALQLPFPVAKHHRIVLITPGHHPPAPRPVSIDGAGFRYDLDVRRDGDKLSLDYTLTGRKPVLEPQDVAAFRSDYNRMDDANYWRLDLDSDAGGGGFSTKSTGPLLLALGIVAVGFLNALRRVRTPDAPHAEPGDYYYPVTLWTFSLMSVATYGLYPAFWSWKFWRWVQTHGRPTIRPFWRAVFCWLWAYPMFQTANRRARALPDNVGVFAAVALYVGTLADFVLLGAKQFTPFLPLFAVAQFVFYLPAVLAVKRLNAGSRALALNSRITLWSVLAIAAGLALWFLTFSHISVRLDLPPAT